MGSRAQLLPVVSLLEGLGTLPSHELLVMTALGAAAGLCSGLLGIGGGLVTVPGLLLVLHGLGYPDAVVPLLAAGTSLGLMVFTALGSAWGHWRNGTIRFDVLQPILPWVLSAELAGVVVAHWLRPRLLEQLMAVLVLSMGVLMLRPRRQEPPEASVSPPHRPLAEDHPLAGQRLWVTGGVSGLIGLKSGIFGLGGGAIAIPYFSWIGLEPRQVAGTTSLLTWPLALIGGLIYFFSPEPPGPHLIGVHGAVQLLAIAVMAPVSMAMAPLGSRLCMLIPQSALRLLFALFLMAVGLRVLL